LNNLKLDLHLNKSKLRPQNFAAPTFSWWPP
jgi:hypothetical protein